MINTILSKGVLIGAFLLAGSVANTVYAEESSSFVLYHEFPNYDQRGAEESQNFRMNEDGITWVASPLVGSSFQITTAPPAAAQEPEPEEPQPPTDEEGGGGTEGQGRRPRPEGTEPAPEPEPHPAPPPEPVDGEDIKGEELQPGDIDFGFPDRKPIYNIDVRYPSGERLLGPLHYFYTIDPEGKRIERILVPQYLYPRDILVLLEQNKTSQVRMMLLQTVASLSFLLAFQVFLLQVPQQVLVRIRRGSIFVFPWCRRKKKDDESKKGKKRTSNSSRKKS
ncbi:MAG: hypothetical protein WCX61_02075 [Candidatus Peribacteraceae bacterium]|jgi:hypothetical protein